MHKNRKLRAALIVGTILLAIAGVFCLLNPYVFWSPEAVVMQFKLGKHADGDTLLSQGMQYRLGKAAIDRSYLDALLRSVK